MQKVTSLFNLLCMCILVSACSSGGGDDNNTQANSSCDPNQPPYPTCSSTSPEEPEPQPQNQLVMSEQILVGKTLIHEISSSHVLVTLNADYTFDSASNDNQTYSLIESVGTWSFDNDTLTLYSGDDTNIITNFRYEHDTWFADFSGDNATGLVALSHAISIETLTKGWYSLSSCHDCTIWFKADFTGSWQKGDAFEADFTWHMGHNDTIHVDYGTNIGSAKYTPRQTVGNGLNFVTVHTYVDDLFSSELGYETNLISHGNDARRFISEDALNFGGQYKKTVDYADSEPVGKKETPERPVEKEEGNLPETTSIGYEDLVNRTFIDSQDAEKLVILHFGSNHALTEVSNDNTNLQFVETAGEWTAYDNVLYLVYTDDDTPAFDIESYQDYNLNITLQDTNNQKTLLEVVKPETALLSKSYSVDACSTCFMTFNTDHTGVGGEGNDQANFTWQYEIDGSILVTYEGGIGEVQYFFTSVSAIELDYVAVQRFADEQTPSIQASTLIAE